MHTITTTASLRDAIRVLEETCAVQERELKYEVQEALERLKPKNLARTAVTRITESPEVKRSVLPALASLITGYLSRRVLVGSTHNPFKRITGWLVQLGIASLGARYRSEIDVGLKGLLLSLLGGGTRHRHQQV